jgi:hypothetical protein
MIQVLLTLVPRFVVCGTAIVIVYRVFNAHHVATVVMKRLDELTQQITELEKQALCTKDYEYLMSSAAKQNMQ